MKKTILDICEVFFIGALSQFLPMRIWIIKVLSKRMFKKIVAPMIEQAYLEGYRARLVHKGGKHNVKIQKLREQGDISDLLDAVNDSMR
jgi:hypothetical protein